MFRPSSLPAFLVATALVACGPAKGSASDAEMDANTDAGALDPNETSTVGSGGGGLAAVQESATLANSLFAFDPTINPSATPAANAAAIGTTAQSELGTCGQVTVSGAMVTVQFGSPPGCVLANGVAVSGSAALTVSQSGGTTSIGITFSSLVVNGESLSGQGTFATTNGSTFNVSLNVTSGTTTVVATLTVAGSSGSFTISGTATVTESTVTSSLTFASLVHVLGQCYASSGTLTITKGLVTETMTFNAQTPATGEVSVQSGRKTVMTTLPAYGSCPSGDAVDGGPASDAGRGILRDGGF